MSELFDLAARQLERHSSLDAIEARGTLRIALKAGGVDARTVEEPELRAVLEKLMPRELEVRGIADPEAVCRAVLLDIEREYAPRAAARAENADDVFRRLGGD